MGHDQTSTRREEAVDLIAEFRRVADKTDFDDPGLAAPPPVAGAPPPLPVSHSNDDLSSDLPVLPALPPGVAFALTTAPGVAGSPGVAGAQASTAQPSASDMRAAAPTRLPPALPLGSTVEEAPAPPEPAAVRSLSQSPGRGRRSTPPALGNDKSPPTLEASIEASVPESAPVSSEAAPDKTDRRAAKRRAAMPSRDQIAANDDAPSIGGLLYALNQKPSRKPFTIASTASAIWAGTTLLFATYYWGNELVTGAGLGAFVGRPEMLTLLATLLGPVGLMFALAVIAYRVEEMRLRSSAMTEVAVRLAEPDRMAEQQVASLGQAVRRQVTFMNDAVSRAIGRAGELEALVHNEVTALERSYSDNEQKIRLLIQELSGERNALFSTSERVADTLRSLGSEVPGLLDTLSSQQIKLTKIIEGASQNLTQLESAIATQSGNLEIVVEEKAQRLQTVLADYTVALSGSLDSRMESIGETIATRTGDLQLVFEEYTRALDSTLANRADTFDTQLTHHTERLGLSFDDRMTEMEGRLSHQTTVFLDRTQAIDQAFTERLQLFDDAILRSTTAIDQSVGEKTLALTAALDSHAKSLGETLSRQSLELDESLLQGINAVRRTSETITRQSIKALEGLAGQSELLKNVSDNLLSQINAISNRFDSQSQQIIRSANALETANYKIDKTLQTRHAELSHTLDRMSGKAEQLSEAAQGYSRQIEGSLSQTLDRVSGKAHELSQATQGYTRQIEGTISEADARARALTAELAQTAEERSRATLADIERLKATATDTTSRALDDLRSRFSNVSTEVTEGLSSLSAQMTDATDEARRRTAEAANELEKERDRLRQHAQALPGTARESADTMRRVLSDHLRAIDELSSLSRREATSRDVARPLAPAPSQPAARPLIPVSNPSSSPASASLTNALTQELQSRSRPATGSPATHSAAHANVVPVDAREAWKLGDLLKRASVDDEAAHAHAAQQQAHQQAAAERGGLDFAAAARSLTPAAAALIWQRLGTGQRGIMVRSIYTPEGQSLFDDVAARLRSEKDLVETTHQYLADFERVLQEADRQDPSGQTAQGHLRSDYGRVYLFLAHATGRIS